LSVGRKTVEAIGQETAQNAASSATLSLNGVKVSYGCGRYLSHARVARTYRDLIGKHCEVVKEIDRADIVVLHFEPHSFAALFENYRSLKRKYVVGYCVWEASELPAMYKGAIRYVQEIWTCSQYCCEIFRKHHPQVHCVPHVIARDTNYSDADLEFVRQLISYEPANFYFLAITKLWDLRKNTKALVTAFHRRRAAMPKARLIVKAGPEDVIEGLTNEGVIFLRESLSEAQINALYATADVYVSPHHSEGWGLTLSDAMLFKKPVIATGYSGNREFMNSENSWLLDCTVDYIKPEDCFYLFDSSMKWAYPSAEDLEKKLLLLNENRHALEVQRKVRNASRDIQKFSPDSVSAILKQRIMDSVNSERFSHAVARGRR